MTCVLDFACYPHLVAQIADYANYATRLTLRRVSREVKRHVDFRLAEHVALCMPDLRRPRPDANFDDHAPREPNPDPLGEYDDEYCRERVRRLNVFTVPEYYRIPGMKEWYGTSVASEAELRERHGDSDGDERVAEEENQRSTRLKVCLASLDRVKVVDMHGSEPVYFDRGVVFGTFDLLHALTPAAIRLYPMWMCQAGALPRVPRLILFVDMGYSGFTGVWSTAPVRGICRARNLVVHYTAQHDFLCWTDPVDFVVQDAQDITVIFSTILSGLSADERTLGVRVTHGLLRQPGLDAVAVWVDPVVGSMLHNPGTSFVLVDAEPFLFDATFSGHRDITARLQGAIREANAKLTNKIWDEPLLASLPDRITYLTKDEYLLRVGPETYALDMVLPSKYPPMKLK